LDIIGRGIRTLSLYEEEGESVSGISVLDDEIDPSQVTGLMCWRLLGRYDLAFVGEEAVAEEILP
jgi:hypothetical protein